MSDPEYLPPVFYFTLRVIEKPGTEKPSAATEARFQEVSGIATEFVIEPVDEGGENRFVHRLPKPVKHLNLVLKRGVITKSSLLAEWIANTVGSNLASPIQLHDLMVNLLDECDRPAKTWIFTNAYPVKYSVADLKSQDDKILIEALEFTYTDVKRAAPTVE